MYAWQIGGIIGAFLVGIVVGITGFVFIPLLFNFAVSRARRHRAKRSDSVSDVAVSDIVVLPAPTNVSIPGLQRRIRPAVEILLPPVLPWDRVLWLLMELNHVALNLAANCRKHFKEQPDFIELEVFEHQSSPECLKLFAKEDVVRHLVVTVSSAAISFDQQQSTPALLQPDLPTRLLQEIKIPDHDGQYEYGVFRRLLGHVTEPGDEPNRGPGADAVAQSLRCIIQCMCRVDEATMAILERFVVRMLRVTILLGKELLFNPVRYKLIWPAVDGIVVLPGLLQTTDDEGCGSVERLRYAPWVFKTDGLFLSEPWEDNVGIREP